eukprot:14389887-Alexandrium_andersonii.AAC.2
MVLRAMPPSVSEEPWPLKAGEVRPPAPTSRSASASPCAPPRAHTPSAPPRSCPTSRRSSAPSGTRSSG